VVIRRNNLFVCFRFEEKIESRAASRNASLGLTPDAVVHDFAALLKSYRRYRSVICLLSAIAEGLS
jgi:hypothetical protein